MVLYSMLLILFSAAVCECGHFGKFTRRIHEHASPLARTHKYTPNIQCSDATWKQCIAQLASDLHLPSVPTDPMQLDQIFEKMMQTKQGFQNLCSAARSLETCLGEEAAACFSVQHLEHVGVSLRNVLSVRVMYYDFVKECNGEIYNTLESNYPCLMNVSKNYADMIQHCVVDYTRMVQSDPEHLCHFTQEFMACTSKPFKDHCNKALGRAVCQITQESFAISAPQCKKLYCTQTKMQVKRDFDNFRTMIQRLLEWCECPEKPFKVCLDGFKDDIGLSEPLPSDPVYAEYLLNTFLMEDRQNFRTYCRGINRFSDCLGSRETSCMGSCNLMKYGLTEAEAKTYLNLYNQAKYECGDGYNALFYNYECLRSKKIHFADEIQQCKEDSAVRDSSDSCSRLSEFKDCYLPFFDACSSKARRAVEDSQIAKCFH